MRWGWLLLLPWAGCSRATEVDPTPAPAAASPRVASSASSALVASGTPVAPPVAPAGCGPDQVQVDGGVFWMGYQQGAPEEGPRHHVAVRSFCLDRTEVTVAAYAACVRAGACSAPHPGGLCNGLRDERATHPVTCVDWFQALDHCTSRGERLPTEREWEYAARHGDEQREFAWGREPPDGRSCYDLPSTCPVGSYPPGAYGAVDQTGNVWEWTASAFAPYPGETSEGPLRVYRGGSYSRRFPRWMRNGLRNRYKPDEWGAHLGFRCASNLPGATCPHGSHLATDAVRCQPDGEPETAPVVPPGLGQPADPRTPSGPEPVVTTREPGFDADCQRHKPGRPLAFAVRGGSFADRQRAKGACVNRDVGPGYNGVCCAP